MISKLFRPRNIVLLVLLLAVAALSYGFAAQLTLTSSETIVGSASTPLTDYNNVILTWSLGATPNVSPTAHLDFDTNGPYVASEVYLGHSSDDATWNWVTCTDAGGNVWDCILTGVSVTNVNYVQVVAAGAN